MRNSAKRWIALCLALCTLFSLNRGNAWATEVESSASAYSDEQSTETRGLSYNGHYYWIFRGTMSWDDAKAYCESMGGHLATITSEEEQMQLVNLNSTGIILWIGACLDENGEWSWVTGEEWGYTAWCDGEPSGGSECCVDMNPYNWNDMDAGNMATEGFICEWESEDAVPGELPDPSVDDSTEGDSSTDDSTNNENRSMHYNGHYYWRFAGGVSWDFAKAYCESMGGHLVTITSAEEQAAVDAWNNDGYLLWIGACLDENDSWSWVTGEAWDYANWEVGEPSGYGECCANLNPQRWNDLVMEDCCLSGFICEWESEDAVPAELPDPVIEDGSTDEPMPDDTDAVEPISGTIYNDHYYWAFSSTMSWNEAKSYCESLGGYLAVITTAEEQTVVEELNSSQQYLFLGGYLDENQNWNWINGEAWDYTNWADGEPNDPFSEFYLMTIPNQWNDTVDDSNQMGFVCEWDSEELVPEDLRNTEEAPGDDAAEAQTWTLSEDGTLTISGTGDITDTGWKDYTSQIVKIVIEEGITSICGYAFYQHTQVVSVALPESLTAIWESAFEGCTALEEITIPQNVEIIYQHAFNHCTNLKKVTFCGNAPAMYGFDDDDIFLNDTLTAYYPDNGKDWYAYINSGLGGDVTWVPYSGAVIDDNFSWTLSDDGLLTITGNGEINGFDTPPWSEHRDDIVRVVIGEGITAIRHDAFQGCKNMVEISLPDTMMYIDDSAFVGCTSLVELNVPASVTYLCEDFGFSGGCTSFTRFRVHPDNPRYSNDEYGVLMDKDKTVIFDCPPNIDCGEAGEYIVPDTVTYICKAAFRYNTGIKKLVLPEELTSLPYAAFQRATSLETIMLPLELEAIPDEAFAGCTNLRWVYVAEDIVTIGQYAFAGCTSLKAFITRENVIYVGYNAFYNCPNLTKVIVLNKDCEFSTTPIALGSLEDATALTSTSDMQTLGIPGVTVIHGYPGSTAEEFARRYGYDFEPFPAFSITAHPADQTVELNGTATFRVEANGTGMTYQWQYCKPNSTYWFDSSSSGSTTNELSIVAIQTRIGQQYRCVITDENGNTVTSNAATIILQEPDTGIEIVNQPVNQQVAEGETVVFTVEATGEGLTYQWQYCKKGKIYWFDSAMSGSATNALVVEASAARDGQQYRCVITDQNGNSVTTDAAMLTVGAVTDVEITAQPQNQTVAAGENAVFSVTVTGENLTYQWQYRKSGSDYWFDSGIPGSNTSELRVAAKANRDGQSYRCVITDGNGNEVITDEVTLTIAVSGPQFAIVVQPESQTATRGTNAVFAVEAVGEGLTYQWQYSNNGGVYWYNSGMEGNQTNQLTVEALPKRDGQMYRCVIKDADGNVIYSAEAALHVN